MERQNLYTAVSKVFPVLISVNLTRNTYSIMASEGLISHGTDREGKFDELVSLAASATHEEHRELFRKKFNRGSLLRAFAQGEREVHAETRQMGMTECTTGSLHRRFRWKIPMGRMSCRSPSAALLTNRGP